MNHRFCNELDIIRIELDSVSVRYFYTPDQQILRASNNIHPSYLSQHHRIRIGNFNAVIFQ